MEFDALAEDDTIETVAEVGDEGEALYWGSRMPDVSGLTMREVLDLLSQHELVLEYQGSGVATAQEPPKGTVVAKGEVARISFGSVSP
jgi:hypothetical protein